MAAAGRDEHIEDSSTEKSKQRIGGRCRDGDASIADDGTETDAAGADAGDDAHNASVERELENDARSARCRFAKGTDIGQGGAVEDDAQEEEKHDDGVEVERAAAQAQVNNEIGETEESDEPTEEMRTFEAVGRSGRKNGIGHSGRCVVGKEGWVDDEDITFGVHPSIDSSDGGNDGDDDGEIIGAEDGVRDRDWRRKDPIGSLSESIARGSHSKRDRAREAGMPDDEATIGRSDEEPIVDALEFFGYLLGENDADNEAKTPVEPTSDSGDESDKSDGGSRGSRDASKGTDGTFDSWGGSKGRATDQDQSHLHGKSKEVPHSPTPMFENLDRRLLADRHGEEGGQKSKDDGKDERLGEPTLDKFDTNVD